MDLKSPCVYMLASKTNGVLYIGVTSDLIKRVWEHKIRYVSECCKTYNVDKLIWFEMHSDMRAAITREKQLKKWNRKWKIRLIEESNPDWSDLYSKILSGD